MKLTVDDYATWKKELQKACKSWDAAYQKHQRTKNHDYMQDKVHDIAMQPLWELIQTNHAFDLLQ